MTPEEKLLLIENNKGTRFGTPGAADQATLPKNTAIRAALRRIAAFEFDVDVLERGPKPSELMRIFTKGGRTITGAQLAAIKKYSQAFQNYKAMDTMIDQVDGKQVQTIAQAQVTLADLVNGSYEVGNAQEEHTE
jgi:hypothetical protein